MSSKIILVSTILFLTFKFYCQIPIFYFVPKNLSPKYGFLPGVKFPIYPTVSNYYLQEKKINPIFVDNRNSFNSISCSDTQFLKDSEFEGLYGLLIFKIYFDTLLIKANAIIDTINGQKLNISLEVLTPQLIGHGEIAAHGLCQFKVTINKNERQYCLDIRDGDPNSPLRKDQFATRKTASRQMTSASIRGAIEKFLTDITN